MTPFIIFCAVMLVAAIAFVAVPLLRGEGTLPKGQRPTPKATASMAALAVVLPIAAVALYSGISNFPWDDPMATASAPGHGEGAGSMDEVTRQLEARLAANPGDLEGWRMLGRTYLVGGNPAKAVTAYERAIEIAGGGGDLQLQLDLAEALVLTDDPSVQDRARKIIDEALAANGNDGKALWYSGVLAIRSGDQETAKTRWTKLLEQNPPDEIRQIVVQQLAELGVAAPAMASNAPMAGPPPGMAAAAEAAPAAAGRTIRIALSVDPKVADKLRPGTPLFVAARQPGIPGPPIAAVRLTSDSLPTTVVLSDANSMIEGRNLSSIDDVEIVARVAFGGTAVTASGDLIGKGQQKKGGAADVAIVIDQVAP